MRFPLRIPLFLVVFVGSLLALALLSPQGVCARERQEETRTDASATPRDLSVNPTTLSPEVSSLSPETTSPLQGETGTSAATRPFRSPPFPILFKNQSMILPFSGFQELEKILFRGERKNLEPAYSLQKLEASGQVEDRIARLRIALTFSTSSDPLVKVPIGLRGGVSLLTPSATAQDETSASPLEYKGKGACDLTVDSQSGDYVLLVRNASQNAPESEEILNQTHHVSFSLSFSVEDVAAGEQRLKLNCPQAVASRLLLTVPMNDAVAVDAGGTMIIRTINPSSVEEESPETQFEIQGLPKAFDLTWHRQVESSARVKQAVLQVEDAQIHVRMSPRETEFDATLPVRSIGGPLQQFFVRLPSQTRFIAEATENAGSSEYQVREIPANSQAALSDSGLPVDAAQTAYDESAPLLEITVTGGPKQNAFLPIRLHAVRTFPGETQSSWCELGGFEVLGAERQSGHLEIIVHDDLKLNLDKRYGIREDDVSEAAKTTESPYGEHTRVRFAYYTQPFTLEARVVFPQTSVSVKPEYQVLLEKGQMTLTGRIQATISGMKTNQLQWNFYDWNLVNIGPGSVIDSSGIVHETGEAEKEKGTTTIPLRFPDAPVEMSFTATRPIPPMVDSKTTIDFPLPLPIADRMEAATVVIVPADNLELPPAKQEVVGMSRVSRNVSPRIPLPVRQQEPLIFRSDIPADLANFSLSFRSEVILHKQEVLANSRTVVRILEQKDQIEQTIRLNVKFEPLDQITLLIPRSVDDGGTLKIFFDDKAIPDAGRSSFPEVVLGTDLVRRRLALPNPLIGNGLLQLRYSMEPTEIQREMTMRITVPQILPVQSEIVEQTVVALAPGGVNVLLSAGDEAAIFGRIIPSTNPTPLSNGSAGGKRNENGGTEIPRNDTAETTSGAAKSAEAVDTPSVWKKVESPAGTENGLQETTFHTMSWESSIPLSVQLDYMDILGTTVVERAWIQTWLMDRVRVDRASFRIRSDHEKIPLHLPPGFDRNRVSVSWDNGTIPFQYEDGAIILIQPQEQRSKSHLLVVKYQTPNESGSKRLKIDLPYFNDDVWVRRMYWQVILRQNRHLLGDCPGWTPEFYWNWNGLYWNRDSSLQQEELELWIGSAEPQELQDASDTNRYLFSSFNPRRQCEIYVLNRGEIVLYSSGAVLLIGLALIYFSWLRQIGVLFTLGVLLISLMLYQPTPALLVLQASILGILLALMSAILARILYREPEWKFATPAFSPSVATQVDGLHRPSLTESHEVILDSTHHKSSHGATE